MNQDSVLTNVSGYQGYPYYTHVFSFEQNYDLDLVLSWMEQNWRVPFYITALYLIAVYVFYVFMQNKQPVDVRKYFLCWNIFLAIFSILGTLRALPELTYVLRNYGFEFSVCNNTANPVSGFWVTAFIISKGIELLETTFLLLRKKLNWIHLCHHVVAFVSTWFFSFEKPALGRWATSLNITVHAFMYCYFSLKAARINIPEEISFCMTSAQILQFFILYVTSVYATYVKFIGRPCGNSYPAGFIGVFVYPYFTYIFGKYFVRRYFGGRLKSKKM